MRINKNHKIKNIAGEKVIILQGEYGTDFTKIISFNASSEWLYELYSDKEFTENDIKQSLLSRYNVAEIQAEEDAHKWIEKLKKYHLIEA
jgi:hypothetical protein